MLRPRGFTLIEVMVTVGIVAILAAIAIPTYAQYVMRARITGAVSNLSTMRVKMEQYFQDNRTYNNPAAPPCGLPGTSVAPLPTDANFTFACVPAPNATQYTVVATGIGSMLGFQYSIDQNNNRVTIGLRPDWVGAGNPCWVLKQDGSC